MITHKQFENARQRAKSLLKNVGVHLTHKELESIEVADFGLGELETSGAQILTLVDTEKIGVKLVILFPNQTLPEHRHPPLGNYPGKEESIRCEWGELYLYGPGEPTVEPRGAPPSDRRHTYTVWNEKILLPGTQLTLSPNVPHWLQAGPRGAVAWSFSTKAVDIKDVFSDPDITRETIVINEEREG